MSTCFPSVFSPFLAEMSLTVGKILAIGGFKVVSDVSKHSMSALLLDHERF